MARGPARTKKCTATEREGRHAKARQFWEAAVLIEELMAAQENDLVDAYVTLCVHAGIAAADAICCARLGEHAVGEDHDEAIQLLASADRDAAKHLRTLLGMKTRSGYSATKAAQTDRKRARRAASTLVDAADRTRHQRGS